MSNRDVTKLNAEVIRLTKTGLSRSQVGEKLGMSKTAVTGVVNRHNAKNGNELRVREAAPRINPRPKPIVWAVPAKPLPEGQMPWITIDGATVTLPSISGISCPRQPPEYTRYVSMRVREKELF